MFACASFAPLRVLSMSVFFFLRVFQSQGGQFLTDFAPLCRITCTDESEYTIYRWADVCFAGFQPIQSSGCFKNVSLQLHPGTSPRSERGYFRNAFSLAAKGKSTSALLLHVRRLPVEHFRRWFFCQTSRLRVSGFAINAIVISTTKEWFGESF